MNILQFLYPENIYCMSCGSIISEDTALSICENCKRKIGWTNKKTCKVCGRILKDSYLTDICPGCIKSKPFFDRAVFVMKYDERARRIILGLKDNNKFANAINMGKLMSEKILETDFLKYSPTLIPIPLTKKKEATRGFNQSTLIGNEISKFLKIPLQTGILSKVKDTGDIKRINASERIMVLEDAFKLKENIEGQSLILIDDVMTTGATVNACAKLLKENGAEHIFVCTFAGRTAVSSEQVMD